MKFKRAVFILTVFVVLAGVHLFITTQNIDLKYRVTDLKIKLSGIRDRNRELAVKAAGKENLPYIEKTAKEKLDMVYPKKINYVLPGQPAPRPDRPREASSAEATP
jgi:cell division protein FtsB